MLFMVLPRTAFTLVPLKCLIRVGRHLSAFGRGFSLFMLASIFSGAVAGAETWQGTLVAASAAHPRNDSATIVELVDGRLLMVWMEFLESPHVGHDDAPNHLVSMLSNDHGRTWSSREVLVESRPGEINVYNPALIRLKNGDILLTYLAYNQLEWSKPLLSSGYRMVISADAKRHSSPQLIWDHEPYQSANNTFTRLSSGRILRAAEKCAVWGGVSASGCLISDDEGTSWKPSANWTLLPLRGTMEAHIAETKAGDLLMAVRNDMGAVFFSRSADQGMTWSAPQTSGLSAPESMPVLARLPTSGDLLLIWNHSEYVGDYNHYGKRTPLTCAISQDSGRTWIDLKDIETEPDCEFSNPSCNFTSAGEVIITYFRSPMVRVSPPAVFGRSRMDLKAFIAPEAWFSQ